MADAALDLKRSGAPRQEGLASRLIFYLAIPAVMALLLGASASGSGRFAERWAFFAYALSGGLPNWLLNWLTTWAVAIALRPWRPHLLVVTTIAAVAALHLMTPITLMRHYLFGPLLLPGAEFFKIFPWRYNEPRFLLEAVIVWLTSSFTWGGANAFWVYFLGYSRFGYVAAGLPPRQPAEPRPAGHAAPASGNPLLARLPPAVARDIVALRAEQHYTRVYSGAGEILVLIRFSDAVQAMGKGDGLQVHRSHWVRPSAIKSVERLNGTYRLEMNNGLRVPVGRSFKREVDSAGLAATAA